MSNYILIIKLVYILLSLLGDDFMQTKRIGNIGESRALFEFVKREIPVYLPFGDNETADLLAEFNGKINKI